MRRSLIAPVIAGSLILTLAPSAAGRVPHTVGPGETLWSIAAASNLTTRTLAAANGLPETANVALGSTIWIPSEAEGTRALAAGGVASGSAPAPEPLGGYTVRAGDTLSGIAARSGISVSELAWMNGLDPDQALLAGTPLKLPTGASPARTAPAPPNPTAVPNAAPHPTPEFVSPGQVGQVASANGVSPSLAAAVARQESGFNNNLVSGANARGVMQILPGTWDFVQRNLASSPMNPAAAQDNVHAGVMYLGQLVRDTGGDEAAATAAYYQGLGSVRRIGLLPETRRYVANVMALRRVYGGP